MTHCHSGVEKGIKQGGRPIEVMGLCLGRPDTSTCSSSATTTTTSSSPSNNKPSFIITDVFPLPIEGFETRVIADDDSVINYMIKLGESLESTRNEKFMGWYHSHPFDLSHNSHCFLSSTDITTQLQWQRAEDPHGNPFIAIVVDPLRSLHKDKPEIKAFRVYPPEYNSSVENECPNGDIIKDEKVRLEKWGSCWSRYYELEIDYFMSQTSRNVMDVLTKKFMWMKTLGSRVSLENENRDKYPNRVSEITNGLGKVDIASLIASSGKGDGRGGSGVGVSGMSMEHSSYGVPSALVSSGSDRSGKNEENHDLIDKACDGVVNFATEKIQEKIVQVAKKDLFA